MIRITINTVLRHTPETYKDYKEQLSRLFPELDFATLEEQGEFTHSTRQGGQVAITTYTYEEVE